MNNYLFDTHAHITKEFYEDIDTILKNASEMNVKKIITSGCDQASNEESLKIIKKYGNIYCTLGIHPEYQHNYTENDLIFIEKNLENNKVIAIGEIGLDYHYENFNKEKQIILFEKQLILAEKYNLPVVVHSRDATKDTLEILKKYKVTGVIHSFSGSLETAKEYIKMGFFLGINGVTTFKNCKMIEVYKEIGLDYTILETDSPFLSPVPLRGKQNEPKNIYLIAKFLSEHLNLDLSKVTTITTINTYKIFKKLK